MNTPRVLHNCLHVGFIDSDSKGDKIHDLCVKKRWDTRTQHEFLQLIDSDSNHTNEAHCFSTNHK